MDDKRTAPACLGGATKVAFPGAAPSMIGRMRVLDYEARVRATAESASPWGPPLPASEDFAYIHIDGDHPQSVF
jgi:hypothetical protein